MRKYGGRVIGLFRTEFLRLLSSDTDDEEESHYRAYCHALDVIHPDPVIIRTLDLGGDKFLEDLDYEESNPFLGWRAIRICLDRPERFMIQLRAIMRASVTGNCRMMIPMVTDVDQVKRLMDLVARIRFELDEEGVPYDAEKNTFDLKPEHMHRLQQQYDSQLDEENWFRRSQTTQRFRGWDDFDF